MGNFGFTVWDAPERRRGLLSNPLADVFADAAANSARSAPGRPTPCESTRF
jgi:hypothetical protein